MRRALRLQGVFTAPTFAGFARVEEVRGHPAGSLFRILWGDYCNAAGTHPWNRPERGEITLSRYWEDFADRARVEPGTEPDAEEFRDAMLGDLHKARDLRRRYRTALLTNNGADQPAQAGRDSVRAVVLSRKILRRVSPSNPLSSAA